MAYTLATTWLLLAIAAIIGFIIGWFLAKKLCKCDDSALRAELSTAKIEANEHKAKVQGLVGQVDTYKKEAITLKASGGDAAKSTSRIGELEAALAGAGVAAAAATLAAKSKHDGEINALKAELTAATAKHTEAEQKIQGFAAVAGSSGSAEVTAEWAKLSARIAELEAEKAKSSASVAPTNDDSAKLSARIAELEAEQAKGVAAAAAAATAAAGAATRASSKHAEEVAALQAQLADCQAKNEEAQSTIQGFAAVGAGGPSISSEQLSAGAAILGVSKLGMDDLKVVEGIGPKIDELLVAGGITTWHQLSNTAVEQIQSILDAAGPNFKVANPSTWARQAGLLANAQWVEFKTLTDQLDHGIE
jgi:predicted flap endonuclease-1-like 5' DNA nuclease